MRRIVVVAHRTLGGQALLDEVARRMRDGDCRVHLVVPIRHPMGAFSEATCVAEAERVLAEGTRRIRDLDRTGSIEVTGEVGDVNPVYAVECVRNRHEPIDEIVVSTLPAGPSAWLRGDIPTRMARAFPDVAVTHVIGTKEPATA
jgi:hypothetical protein